MTQNPDAESGPVEHHILIVSPDREWNKAVTKALGGLGISRETVPSAGPAIDRLTREQEDDEKMVTSVITEGLRGNWRRVVEAAMEAGVTPVMMTKSSLPPEGAAEMGVQVFAKQQVEGNPRERQRFVQAVAPQN